MNRDETFTPTHHALLYAWIGRAVAQRVGQERAKISMCKAVRHYGNQRGRRMALRALADGQELSMLTYLIYGEWRADESTFQRKNTSSNPDLHSLVSKCPWNTAWLDNDLIPFGRTYCLEIDRAIAEGFNPQLLLEVKSTQPNEHCDCDFIFHDANLTPENSRYMAQRQVEISSRIILPWSYHTAHLYFSLREVLIEEFGETGAQAAEDALSIFTAHYGHGMMDSIRSFSAVDFWTLPVQG